MILLIRTIKVPTNIQQMKRIVPVFLARKCEGAARQRRTREIEVMIS
jgi:hypothetical protein